MQLPVIDSPRIENPEIPIYREVTTCERTTLKVAALAVASLPAIALAMLPKILAVTSLAVPPILILAAFTLVSIGVAYLIYKQSKIMLKGSWPVIFTFDQKPDPFTKISDQFLRDIKRELVISINGEIIDQESFEKEFGAISDGAQEEKHINEIKKRFDSIQQEFQLSDEEKYRVLDLSTQTLFNNINAATNVALFNICNDKYKMSEPYLAITVDPEAPKKLIKIEIGNGNCKISSSYYHGGKLENQVMPLKLRTDFTVDIKTGKMDYSTSLIKYSQ